jgi:hypothetical protein
MERGWEDEEDGEIGRWAGLRTPIFSPSCLPKTYKIAASFLS